VSSAYTRALEAELEGPSALASAGTSPSSLVPATALTLRADTGEDTFLRAMLRLRGIANDC
jgi:hypothetical protein